MSEDSKKVLILGDGLLGSELVKQSGWDYLSRKHGDFNIHNLSLINDYNPDIIINCIGHTDTYDVNREKHWAINYEFVDDLVDYCNYKEIKLVHISTDYVYANSKDNAKETDVPVHAENWYSYTKLLGDAHVQLKSNDYLLCRCSHKPKPFAYDNAWMDYVGNFDYVDVIASKIINLIKLNASGIYNVGTDMKNMYQLAKQTKNVKRSLTPDHIPNRLIMNIDKQNKCLSGLKEN